MGEPNLSNQELCEYREGLFSALEAVTDALALTVGKIHPDHWHIPAQPGGYSPHYIMTRLLVLEEQMYAAMERFLLDEDIQVMEHFDEVAWLAMHYNPEKPLPALLDEFMRLSKAQAKKLSGLTPGDWNRLSRHLRWGVRTLQWWVEHQLEVSRQHVRELEAFIAQ